MLINILVGLVAYIFLVIIATAKNNRLSEKNEYGLVYPEKLSKVYFLNIIYVLILIGYSYYVFNNQSGWSMYTMLIINFIFFISGYLNFAEEVNLEEEK